MLKAAKGNSIPMKPKFGEAMRRLFIMTSLYGIWPASGPTCLMFQACVTAWACSTELAQKPC